VLDRPPEWIEPDDEQGFGRELTGELGEAADRVEEGLAARDHGVHDHFVPHLLQQRRHLVADQVVRQWYERTGAVVDDHVVLRRSNQFDQGVEVAGLDLVALHDFQEPDVQRLEAVEGGVHWIGVDAQGLLPLADLVLRNHRRDERLADAALALQNHVNLRHQSRSSFFGVRLNVKPVAVGFSGFHSAGLLADGGAKLGATCRD